VKLNYSVCAYPETAQALLDRTGAEIALELQSFGLKGVKSPQAWKERADFYLDFARAHRDRIFHLHGPFLDLPWWTYDHLIEDAVRRRVSDTVTLCEEILPEHLVMHLSCRSYFCRADRAPLWADHALEFLSPYLTRLGEMGIVTVFENTAEPNPVAAQVFADLAANAGLPASICLDIGHAHAFSPTPPHEWVRGLGNRIAHYHIHDNDQVEDWHRAPGEGTIDFNSLIPEIARLSPDTTLSMEIETGVEETLRGLEYIRKFED
jgi:sugar phosphate isomerase/epimerase